jgi:proline racemase
MLEKRRWTIRHADALRRTLMREPRGHEDLCGALLTEPVTPGAHAGLLFMDADGYPPMSGHGVMAATTIALERGLVMPGGDGLTIVFDTPAGTVRARASSATGEADRDEAPTWIAGVTVSLVPSFVLYPGIALSLGTRQVRADIAFGGGFYAIVDTEAVGLPIDAEHLPDLRRAAIAIAAAAESAATVVHPLQAPLSGMRGTIFTGPPADPRADLRTVAIAAHGSVGRSPSGTGTAAVMAVLDAMGLLTEESRFTAEGLIGTRFVGRIASRTMVGDQEAIVPEVAGEAWITGEHQWIVDDRDPLAEGFRLP